MAEGENRYSDPYAQTAASDVKFKDLGLLIVDEEHRFGVRHKERIKAMRANVDILTLTATPIPTHADMAMSGMRDLSIIATRPPVVWQ
ncbi:DEAD/DEAH box helicase [Shigella flexneri]